MNVHYGNWNMVISLENERKEKLTGQDLEYDENHYQRAKWETQTVGPGIW